MLVIFDLDHFKKISDNYGHTTGDLVLRDYIECCTQALCATDMLFRFDGEEFVIVLHGVNADGAALATERLRSIVEKHVFNRRQCTVPVTISIGTASLTAHDSMKTILERADKALYLAESSGRNKVSCSHNMKAATALSA